MIFYLCKKCLKLKKEGKTDEEIVKIDCGSWTCRKIKRNHQRLKNAFKNKDKDKDKKIKIKIKK